MLRKALCSFTRLAAVILVVFRIQMPADAAFDLTARTQVGAAARVDLSLQLGGELITLGEKGAKVNLPVSAVGHLQYDEQVLQCARDSGHPTRALRRYAEATATLKVEDAGEQRTLPNDKKLILADVEDGRLTLNGLEEPINRDQLDLIKLVGDPLVLGRLLPNREIAEGDGWDHDAEAIAALLGFDHVAMCKVRSEVVGAEHDQVKLSLTGTATGAVEGAPTEVELRAAYLYHLGFGRITKFNLAVQESRKIGPVAPGLNVVAKLSLVARPISPKAELFSAELLARAANRSSVENRQLIFDSPERGCRFRHDDDWFVTAVQPELLSLRLLIDGDLAAHCNVRTLPTRVTEPNGEQSMQELEADVRRALGDKLRTISSATHWESPAGCQCVGVFADGEVDGVAMQWRYFLLMEQGKPQLSISVTVEKDRLDLFADADRPLIDSLELLDRPSRQATAAKPAAEPEQK